jgi:hypothetical protein
MTFAESKTISSALVIAAALLAVSLVAGNAALLKAFHAQRPLPDLVQIVCAGFIIAEGSLVAVWIAFGHRPLPMRLTLAIPCVALIAIPYFTLPKGASTFAIGMMFVVGLSVPSLVARAAGWNLRRGAAEPTSQNGAPIAKPGQFTLRQMFGWTLAFAMVAGLARFLLEGENLRPRMVVNLLINAIVCFACGGLALATVWSSLGRRNPIRRLPLVVFLTGLIPTAAYLLLGANRQPTFMLVGAAVCDAVFAGCGLLLFRLMGYRLVRQHS